jgi:hypothetical protein
MTGLFDAVLLLALPTFIVWPALGALGTPEHFPEAAPQRGVRGIVIIGALVLAGAGLARSAAQLTAMQMFADGGSRAALSRAAMIDPGNYRLQLRLARGGKRDVRCEHARAAHELYPNASAAKELARGCR